jgi:F-type H+-transporting ATPase subunit b
VPQLEVWTFPSQIFWLIICFSILYYLLSRKALPRVSEILEARQDRIAADLDQAQRLRREAQAALATYEQAIAKAQDDAHRLLAEAQNRLQADAAERQAELDRQLGKQLMEAEQRIAAARDRALAELEDAAVGAAQAAAERLAGIKVSARAAQRALHSVRERVA